jgi:hypothetical protein
VKPTRNIALAAALAFGSLAGAYAAAQSGFQIEHDVNRMHGDYRNFALDRPDPNLCLAACAADDRCRAFTYVKEGGHGQGVPGTPAHCWLKDTLVSAQQNGCCISGVKSGAGGGGAAAGIRVLEATYGGNCGAGRNNAGAHIASVCNGRGECNYRVDVSLLGDPAPNCPKGYEVHYQCAAGGQALRADFSPEANLGTINLKCP